MVSSEGFTGNGKGTNDRMTVEQLREKLEFFRKDIEKAHPSAFTWVSILLDRNKEMSEMLAKASDEPQELVDRCVQIKAEYLELKDDHEKLIGRYNDVAKQYNKLTEERFQGHGQESPDSWKKALEDANAKTEKEHLLNYNLQESYALSRSQLLGKLEQANNGFNELVTKYKHLEQMHQGASKRYEALESTNAELSKKSAAAEPGQGSGMEFIKQALQVLENNVVKAKVFPLTDGEQAAVSASLFTIQSHVDMTERIQKPIKKTVEEIV